MNTLKATLLIVILLTGFMGCKQQKTGESEEDKSTDGLKPELISKWSTDSVMRTPESVKYDSDQDVLYVSNIQGESNQKDGEGFISRVSPDGEVLDLKWVTGLDAPKGMGIYEGKLYVTNIDEIVEIDIAEGEIANRYPMEGAQFGNDIDVNEAGAVFASDMRGNKIYRLKNGSVEVWLESDKLESPNGLFAKQDHLLIGINGAVLRADYETTELEEFISNTGGIDGLEEVGDGYYIKSDWAGHVHLLHPDQEKILILDTTDDNINAADIDFIPETNMLYVPTFNDNRVMAYELKR
ncbi:MAG: gluconolaconase [Bacteroidota bacterium]